MKTETKIDPRLIKARVSLIVLQPFYGSLAMQLEFVMTRDVQTMATDGKKIFVNPDYLDTLTEQQLIFVLAHEVSHCAYRHHTRRQNRDPDLWNTACDIIVNPDLTKAGMVPPPGIILMMEYYGLSTEEVFAILAKQQQQPEQPEQPEEQQTGDDQKDQGGDDAGDDQGDAGEQDGSEDDQSDDQSGDAGDDPSQSGEQGGDQSSLQADQGDPSSSGDDGEGEGDQAAQSSGDKPSNAPGAGGKPTPDYGNCGAILDAAPQGDAGAMGEEDANWEANVRQALNVAAKANAGSLPSNLERLAEATKKPIVDWHDVLRRFIDDRSRIDYSWTQPNRRLSGYGFAMPGVVRDGMNHLGVAIDTSGSIDNNMLAQFSSELQAAVDAGIAQSVTVIYCDATVNRVERYERGDSLDIRAVGGGGTRFAPVFEWFAEQEPDISALIYFTDLDSTDFGCEPERPLLWAAYGDPREVNRLAAQVPFGEVIKLI